MQFSFPAVTATQKRRLIGGDTPKQILQRLPVKPIQPGTLLAYHAAPVVP